jgi:hypothetical protein
VIADFGFQNVIRWYGLMAIAGMDNVLLRGFLFPRFRGSSLRSERHEGQKAVISDRGQRTSGYQLSEDWGRKMGEGGGKFGFRISGCGMLFVGTV